MRYTYIAGHWYPRRMSPSTRLLSIRELLGRAELYEALATLNSAVPHRFTAAYRLTDGVFHNVAIVDELGEITPDHLLSVPMEHSFCQFVMRDNGVDITNSADDRRLDGHPYQGVMISYSGVPIMDANLEIVGTLCHFDTERHRLAADEYELLWQVARVIQPSLLNAVTVG